MLLIPVPTLQHPRVTLLAYLTVRRCVRDGETQTELTTKDIAVRLQENEAMKQRLRDMEHSSEPAEKEEAINLPEITRTVVMQSDKTLKFYTELVSATMFRALLQFVVSIWTPSHTTSLDAEQQLLLVLMRTASGAAHQ
ncbi:hypothetical protein HPB49_005255 [Dermacentor silvarum]|uniref:Uncharacterized protein n=1 Tax=Dermacentor silvarum TaxID=543639 RepID=A0ACB8CVW9_DERSI|nr:hypothetical protein HPB49_005255 [Dermacentor silvarum]